ncbi:MAG: class I SAM-dependent methyltransferase [Acidimicrobiales bacterium]
MSFKETDSWSDLDGAFQNELSSDLDLEHIRLLTQTVTSATGRRALMQALRLGDRKHALDLGTGFGPVVFELAALGVADLCGVDNDQTAISAARRINASLQDWISDGCNVAFEEGDATGLRFDDSSFDLVTSFLLYQHVDNPLGLTAEAWRVLEKGGLFCAVEVDNGLSVMYPEPSEAVTRLEAAYDRLASRKGGDRLIGRKLSTMLDNQGFNIEAILVLPNAAHGPSRPGDLGRQLDLERLMIARDDIVGAGILTSEEMEEYLSIYAAEETSIRFRLETLIAVVGQKP